jgi:D-alanine--poly(phosphoribitol) ligase subunit 1
VVRTDQSAAATELFTVDAALVKSAPLQDFKLEPTDEEKVFYVTFTSGSTGQPKGIPTTRASYAALADWFESQNTHAAGGAFAHVNHASMAFDMSMSDIWSALFAGRALYLLDHANTLNPRTNIRHMKMAADAPVGGLAATPAFYALMLQDPQFSAQHLPTLLSFWIGG